MSADDIAVELTAPRPQQLRPWISSILLLPLRWSPPFPAWVFGVAVFGVYWIVPLTLSFIDGSALSQSDIAEIRSLSLPPVIREITAMDYWQTTMGSGLSYLTDITHFLFAAVLSIGSVVAVLALKSIHVAVGTLDAEKCLAISRDRLEAVYYRSRKRSNGGVSALIALILAIATGAIFTYFATAEKYEFWWGSHVHGVAGYYIAGIETLMVLYGTRVLFVIAGASLMIRAIVRQGLNLRPFSADGCNGLSPIGRIIVLFWLLALLVAGAIFVTVYFGYLDLNAIGITWVLAVVTTVVLPFVAIVPLVACAHAIYHARRSMLAHIEPASQGALLSALGSFGQPSDTKSGSVLEGASHLHATIANTNIWPFSQRALAFVTAVYALQTVATVSSILL